MVFMSPYLLIYFLNKFKEYQGTFLNCIKRANGSAKYLLKLIVDSFPAYRDETLFLERKGNLLTPVVTSLSFEFSI